MTKKVREGFDSYYQKMFQERWPDLRAALVRPKNKVAMLNPFSNSALKDQLISENGLYDFNAWNIQTALQCCVTKSDVFPEADENGILSHYNLDLASVIVPLQFSNKGEGPILDLCSAPGGKALTWIFTKSDFSHIILNEYSKERKKRLSRVVHEYLPAEIIQKLEVKGFDGSRWGLFEKEIYQKILIDAPCSGEAYILQSTAEMAEWSPARSRKLSIRQYALLASAWMALKNGGEVIYSTCALSVFENDQVISKLLERKGEEVNILTLDLKIGEPTQYGWQILPDQTSWGPIYLCRLQKGVNHANS
jgi:16S rRNA C967 or C1407 C5-methylase (RsmB/RsmF family)